MNTLLHRRKVMGLFAVVLVIFIAAGAVTASALAQPPKVTICHWSDEDMQYVEISISERALAGHGNHEEDLIPAWECPTDAGTATPTPSRPTNTPPIRLR
jgi:hypothetical protein